jgi:hypothetical protein
MYDEAFGVIAKWHIPAAGAVPLSSLGAGVCVNARGLVLTALHTLQNFITNYSHLTPTEANEIARRGGIIPAQDHERPRFMFLHTLRGRGGVLRGEGYRQTPVFYIHRVEGDRATDIAALALSPTVDYEPLPYLALANTRPVVGDELFFLGHYHPAGTPRDVLGYMAGLAVSYDSGRVRAVLPDRLLLSTSIAKGMSGGPVVDSRSRLVAIVTERWPATLSQRRIGIAEDLAVASLVTSTTSSLVTVADREGINLER